MSIEIENRRPVKSRSVLFFHKLAKLFLAMGLSPNQVSILSSVCAAFGGFSLILAQLPNDSIWKSVFLILALLGVQGRLVCNLVDGLMAVEGGKKTPAGELFNDLPDRISDVTLLLCAGIASRSAPGLWHPMEMAWTASLLAVLTAYIRVLGASMGAGHFFLGPMAKQHRMATLNLGIIGSIFEGFFSEKFGYSLYFSLIIISLGSAITCLRRLNAILKNFQ